MGTLYPVLSKKLRILIYNGDADTCVPYNGNEEWITDLEDKGVFKQSSPWRPWFTDDVKSTPAGAKATYDVVGSDQVLTFRPYGWLATWFRFTARKQLLSCSQTF